MNSSLIYLVQTDTTVGFLSSKSENLSKVKQRDPNQKILHEVDSLQTLKNSTRVPNNWKNKVRRSKLTTFIYPCKESFRIVNKFSYHHPFIKKFKKLHSTSANKTTQSFEYEYAYKNADVMVCNSQGFHEKQSSSIMKINKTKLKRIR